MVMAAGFWTPIPAKLTSKVLPVPWFVLHKSNVTEMVSPVPKVKPDRDWLIVEFWIKAILLPSVA